MYLWRQAGVVAVRRRLALIGAATLLGLMLLAILLAALWVLRPDLFTWRPLDWLLHPTPRYFYTGEARGYLPVKEDFPNGFRTASDAVLSFNLLGALPGSAAGVEFVDDYAGRSLAGRPLRVAFFGLLYPTTGASWNAYQALKDSQTLKELLGSMPALEPPRPAGDFTPLALDWVGASDTSAYYRHASEPDGALGEYTLVFRSDNYLCVISLIQPLGSPDEVLRMPGYMHGYANLVIDRLQRQR
jgi:hypothetical protein